MEFDLDDVRLAAKKAYEAGDAASIKNIADIKYTYDSRSDLPAEVTAAFPLTWLATGKGCYILRRTKRKNLLDLSALKSKPQLEHVTDHVPPFVARLMGTDEQAILTRIRYAGLINQFLNFQANPVQGHHRTTVRRSGQIEVDEVQAGIHGTVGVIVPVSGKGGQDKVSWSQALNLNYYGETCLERFGSIERPLTGFQVRSLCVWLDKTSNEVWIVEFSPEVEDIDDIRIVNQRRFKFVS